MLKMPIGSSRQYLRLDAEFQATKLATTASKKTKELGQSVNEKVKEGTLLNEVGSSMSGLASKFSSAGSKGWKDLSSLWGEPKTTLTSADTSPGEKTSLLMMKSDGSSDDPSKSGLLAEDDDSWGWGGDSWGGDQSQKRKEDDDLEAWLNDDNTSADSAPRSQGVKKQNSDGWDDWSGGGGENDGWSSWDTGSSTNNKSTSSSSKKSSKEKSSINSSSKSGSWDNGFGNSEPALGNLVDLGGSQAGSGWDNEVWADEDDEWQSLDTSSSVNKSSKKSTAGKFRKGD